VTKLYRTGPFPGRLSTFHVDKAGTTIVLNAPRKYQWFKWFLSFTEIDRAYTLDELVGAQPVSCTYAKGSVRNFLYNLQKLGHVSVNTPLGHTTWTLLRSFPVKRSR